MSTECTAAALLLLVAPLGLAAQGAGAPDRVREVLPNTVRVEAAGQTGFGLIVGIQSESLLVATARHTLGTSWDVVPTVCFPPRGAECREAEVAYLADAVGAQPQLDLAILAVHDPGGLAWRPDIEAEAAPGDEVWTIGRSRSWVIPPSPGRVTGFAPEKRHVRYEGLDVAAGVSGGPVVSAGGVVALHLQSETGKQSEGLELAAVRERVVEQMSGGWILLPPADCSETAGTVDLSGRTVRVYLDPHRPGPALRAMALLHCAGARTRPLLVSDGDWSQDGLIYASGDLRAARSIQRLLAPVARAGASLGDPAGDLDLWVR